MTEVYNWGASGELAGSVTAAQLPDIPCRMAQLIALGDNAGNVYLGFTSGVTKADGATDAATGFQLAAKGCTGWIPINNLNMLWRICDNAGDDLTYMVVG